MDKRAGITFVIGSILVAAIFVLVAANRTLTPLENVLLQVFSLGLGLIGSYILGRESARAAAREMVKPHARSAFRRLLSLYRSLSRLAYAIQTARSSGNSDTNNFYILDKLEGIVVEQIATADDALEDWRDIVPEDVEELRAKLTPKSSTEKDK
jgi:hypothetical protein